MKMNMRLSKFYSLTFLSLTLYFSNKFLFQNIVLFNKQILISDMTFPCEDCQAVFPTLQSLRGHEIMKHGTVKEPSMIFYFVSVLGVSPLFHRGHCRTLMIVRSYF